MVSQGTSTQGTFSSYSETQVDKGSVSTHTFRMGTGESSSSFHLEVTHFTSAHILLSKPGHLVMTPFKGSGEVQSCHVPREREELECW